MNRVKSIEEQLRESMGFAPLKEELPQDVQDKIKANNDKMTQLKKDGAPQAEIDALEKENDELNGGNKTSEAKSKSPSPYSASEQAVLDKLRELNQKMSDVIAKHAKALQPLKVQLSNLANEHDEDATKEKEELRAKIAKVHNADGYDRLKSEKDKLSDQVDAIRAKHKKDKPKKGRGKTESLDEANKEQIKKQIGGIRAQVAKFNEITAKLKAKLKETPKDKKEPIKTKIRNYASKKQTLVSKIQKLKQAYKGAKSKPKEVSSGGNSVEKLNVMLKKAMEKAKAAERKFQDGGRNDSDREASDKAHKRIGLIKRKLQAARKEKK